MIANRRTLKIAILNVPTSGHVNPTLPSATPCAPPGAVRRAAEIVEAFCVARVVE